MLAAIFTLPCGFVEAHSSGSRYICPESARQDSDNDTVVLVGNSADAVSQLLASGWESESEDYEGAENNFVSVRKGQENLIVTDKSDYYCAFVLATETAKALRLAKREDRVTLFRAILYRTLPSKADQ